MSYSHYWLYSRTAHARNPYTCNTFNDVTNFAKDIEEELFFLIICTDSVVTLTAHGKQREDVRHIQPG